MKAPHTMASTAKFDTSIYQFMFTSLTTTTLDNFAFKSNANYHEIELKITFVDCILFFNLFTRLNIAAKLMFRKNSIQYSNIFRYFPLHCTRFELALGSFSDVKKVDKFWIIPTGLFCNLNRLIFPLSIQVKPQLTEFVEQRKLFHHCQTKNICNLFHAISYPTSGWPIADLSAVRFCKQESNFLFSAEEMKIMPNFWGKSTKKSFKIITILDLSPLACFTIENLKYF